MTTPLLLTVCTGNVCRSPLLERVLQSRLDQRYGAGAVSVRSGGTGALVDAEMDERSAQLLQGFGGDATGFRSRALTPAMLADAALVLTATREHRALVSRMAPRAMKSTFTVRELALIVANLSDEELPATDDPGERMRELARTARALRGMYLPDDPADLDVVDPYRRADEVYEQVRVQVEQALPQVLRGLGAAG